MNEKKTTIFAVAGKGGVGKTSIAAVMVRLLAERFPNGRILAIDADPAVGLSTALGIDYNITLDDIRGTVIEAAQKGDKKRSIELLAETRYRVLEALTESDGFSFLAVGRPESAGCYCKINAYLKEIISLLADNFDYIVIDGEAGIEQINRRVMEKVTHLILVTDASKKGREVVRTIKDVADGLVMYEQAAVIANRLPTPEAKDYIDTGGVPLIACIPTDERLAEYDMKGTSLLLLPKDSPIIRGTSEALDKLISPKEVTADEGP